MVLIVSEDSAMRDYLHTVLGSDYPVDAAESQEIALYMLQNGYYDLALVTSEADLDAYRKASPQTRIIVMDRQLNAQKAVQVLAGGSNAPAVDYLQFGNGNGNVLRERVGQWVFTLQYGDWSLDTRSKIGYYAGNPMADLQQLTPRDVAIFAVFIRNPNIPMSYERLVYLLDGTKVSNVRATSSLKTHIHHLRKKLEAVAGREVITSQARRGFIFTG